MGIVIRQSLKASLGAYIGIGIGVINQLFISTEFLSPEQIGLSRVLLESSLLFGAFAHLGVPYMGDRLFANYRDNDKYARSILTFMLAVPLIGITLFSIIYVLFQGFFKGYFAEKSPLILDYYYFAIPLTFFAIYNTVLEFYCRNLARIAIPTFVREVYLRFSNLLVVLAFGLGWYSFTTLLYLVITIYGLSVIILLVYIKSLGKFYLDFDKTIFKDPHFKEIISYGLFTVLGGSAMNIVLFIDRTILSGESAKGLTDTAIFTTAVYIASIIEIPRKAISQISIPLIATSIKNEDWKHVETMYKKTALNQLIAGGIMTLLIWVNVEAIFNILPKSDVYSQGIWAVRILLLAKLIDMSSGCNAEIVMLSKYFRTTTYLMLFMAIGSIIFNKWLIPEYRFLGSAMTSLIIISIYGICLTSIVYQKFKIQPFSNKTFAVLMALVVVFLLGIIIPNFGQTKLAILVSIALKSGFVALVYLFLLIYFNVSEDITAVWRGLRERLNK